MDFLILWFTLYIVVIVCIQVCFFLIEDGS